MNVTLSRFDSHLACKLSSSSTTDIFVLPMQIPYLFLEIWWAVDLKHDSVSPSAAVFFHPADNLVFLFLHTFIRDFYSNSVLLFLVSAKWKFLSLFLYLLAGLKLTFSLFLLILTVDENFAQAMYLRYLFISSFIENSELTLWQSLFLGNKFVLRLPVKMDSLKVK